MKRKRTAAAPARAEATRRLPAAGPDLATYDRIVVAFSGGKDSLACLLYLLDLGVERERIELWHHDVDGREGSTLMDWPATRGYCEAIAEAFGVRLLYSWKIGGFEREMLRDGERTAPIAWEEPASLDGFPHVITRSKGGDRGKLGTRRRFPQVSADLRVRWCSAYLKVDVCDRALRNDARFRGSRTLVVTGERAEESAARARYKVFEPHRADNRAGRSGRHVDAWRPVHAWSEQRVWEIIEKYRVLPHPAYRAGWGRVSCAACIFGSRNQWASLRAIAPERFERIAEYERTFETTIQRDRSVVESADGGEPFRVITTSEGAEAVAEALDHGWDRPVILAPGAWTVPAGAYGDNAGPC